LADPVGPSRADETFSPGISVGHLYALVKRQARIAKIEQGLKQDLQDVKYNGLIVTPCPYPCQLKLGTTIISDTPT
jgi:hypothetical protein